MKYIIVGINNPPHIIDNCFECISFECQYDIIINGIWKNNLINNDPNYLNSTS